MKVFQKSAEGFTCNASFPFLKSFFQNRWNFWTYGSHVLKAAEMDKSCDKFLENSVAMLARTIEGMSKLSILYKNYWEKLKAKFSNYMSICFLPLAPKIVGRVVHDCPTKFLS